MVSAVETARSKLAHKPDTEQWWFQCIVVLFQCQGRIRKHSDWSRCSKALRSVCNQLTDYTKKPYKTE